MQIFTASITSSLIALSLPFGACCAQQQDRARQDERSTTNRRDSFQTSEDARLLASQLLDAELEGGGEETCTIEDLVFDTGNRRIAYALVANGDTDRLHAVPISALGIRKTSSDEIRSDMDSGSLDRWPAVSSDQTETATDSSFADRVGRASRNDSRSGSSGQLVLVTDLMDMEVDNDSDTDLGEIENVAIASDSGRAPFVVIGTGGFLGIGETLRALPTGRLEFEEQDDETTLIVPMSEDEIADLPKFERDRIDSRSYGESEEDTSSPSGSAGDSSEDPEGTWIVEIWEIHAVPTTVGPHIVAESARMPLSFPDEGTQRFVVEANVTDTRTRWNDRQWNDGQRNDRQSNDREGFDERNRAAQNQRRDDRSDSGRSDSGRRDGRRSDSGLSTRNDRQASNQSDSKGMRRAVYELSPAKDQQGGSQQIDVKVTWHGAWSDKSKRNGSMHSDPMHGDSRTGWNGTAEAQSDRSRSTTADSPQKEEDGSCCRSFTITVDSDGSISGIDTDSEYAASGDDHAVPLHRDRVQGHLELILGAGTHDGSLKVGEHYTCSAKPIQDGAFSLRYEGRTATDSMSNRSDDSSDEGSTSQPNQRSQRDQSRDRQNSNRGNQHGENKGLAGFSITDPRGPETKSDAGRNTGNEGSNDSRDRWSDRDDQDRDRSMTSDDRRSDWSGMALYSLDDGMVEALFARSRSNDTERTIMVRRANSQDANSQESSASDRSNDSRRSGDDRHGSSGNGDRR